MKRKDKTCKICGNKYKPRSTTQCCCSPACAYQYVVKCNAKKQVKKLQASIKAEKREQRKARESLKTKSQWMAEVQKEFNKYIRLRDKNEPCISCGNTNDVKYDAGHYKTVGAYPELRFEELNCHKQCSKNCNVEKSGNIIEYRKRLIKKIGLNKVEWLEGPHEAKNYTIEDLKELKALYRKKWRDLED